MIISEKLQKKLNKVSKMGLRELEEFKAEVVSSLLDNPTKFYAYDIIDRQLDVLIASPMANNTEAVDFD